MNTTLRRSILTLPVLVAAALAACTGDVTSPARTGIKAPAAGSHKAQLVYGSSVPLATGFTLNPGEEIYWDVLTPDFGSVRLRFDARNVFGSTAGAAPTLEVTVNGSPVQGYALANKGINYTYSDGRTESYFRSTPVSTGPYWTLFYSPDWTQNTVSSNSYYVTTGQPYTYELTITDLTVPATYNHVVVRSKAQWLQSSYNATVPIAFRNVSAISL